MTTRRVFLKGVAGSAVVTGAGLLVSRLGWAQGGASTGVSLGPPELPSGTLETSILDVLPGKRPLIKRTFRPPNYETPIEYFNEVFTPNDAFFVRYHLSNIPEVSAADWRLKIGGEAVERPFELTLDALQKEFEPVEVTAVCLCSGNRRGLFNPHVPGIQWGYGAMGNAKWKGVRLKDLLNKAGLKKEAVEIAFGAADSGILLDKTPDFVKSLPVWKALDENTLVAYEMNGAPMPHWNGHPARLVVPGWTATYWMKQLVSIDALSQPLKSFWMNPAYRIPKGKFPLVDRFVSQEAEENTPITEMVVSSLITNPSEGQQFRLGSPVIIDGIAWDGGYGIRLVEVSTDGGTSWRLAALGDDHGRYSWRQFHHDFTPQNKGNYAILAKATNRIGQTQTFELILNPAGYHHNVVQQVNIEVA